MDNALQQLLRQADPSTPPTNGLDWSERRAGRRVPCRVAGACRPVRFPEGHEGWPAETLDVSPDGVGLLVCRRFEPGTLLGLTLGPTLGGLPLVQVRSVSAVQHRWRLGCQWAGGLEPGEVLELIGASRPSAHEPAMP